MRKLEQTWASAAEGAPGAAESAILLAGIDLFGRRGFGATSVRAIASQADVTPPLINYHFGSKEGLFLECVDAVTRGLAGSVMKAVEQSTDLVGMVRGFATAHLEFPKQFPGALRLLLSVAYGPEEDQPAFNFVTPWAELFERVQARMDRAVEDGEFRPRDGTGVPELTRLLFKLVHMALFDGYEQERFAVDIEAHGEVCCPPEDPVEEIVAQFFRGAGELATPDSLDSEETP